MKKTRRAIGLVSMVLLVCSGNVAFSQAAFAHNRAHIMLPSGECIIVGSEKSVTLPDGTFLDLRPETPPDEIGTAFAANQGQSRIALGPCP